MKLTRNQCTPPWVALVGPLAVLTGYTAFILKVFTARRTKLSEARKREDLLLRQRVLAAERARIARELHDSVASHLALISMQAGALQVTTTVPETRETARSLHRLAAGAAEELRQMVELLRSSTAADTSGNRGTQPRLCDIPGLIEASRLDVACPDIPSTLSGDSPERGAVEHAAYRTVQEGLTNIVKHAPGARVTVRLYEEDRHLHVKVRNGPGSSAHPPPVISGGHGLTGLRERAQLLGGTCIAAPDQDGFLLHAAFPL